ncbi:MAG: DUF1826 domain-containing protein [Pseudomonadota bacterium]
MSLVREQVRDAAIGVALADRPEDLGAFLKPGCAAAIWRRQPAPSFQAWIDGLAPEHLPRGRVVMRREVVRDVVRDLCEIAGTPAGAYRDHLIDDAGALATRFAELTDALYVRVRLDPITGDACRRFHIDAITARLVCTYRGPGTQYGISTDGNAPKRVFNVPTGAPILMRGTLWPEQPATGLLHRSPPIEGTGTTRLVLVVDPVAAPEEAG